jgi:predicted outer membrane repeat protein
VEIRDGGLPAFEDCTFDNNAAKYGGGAIAASGGTVTINRCLFRGNRTTWPFSSGGAVSSSSTLHIANSLFSGNQADWDGSAIYSYGELVLRNSTVAGNRSIRSVAAISADGPVTLINSIVWGNQSPASSTYDAQIETWDAVRFTNSIVQGYDPEEQTWVDGNGISADPLFLSPASAASTPTIAGDYHVASCSPAVQGGINAQSVGPLDLAGNPRIVGAAIDLGAYEAQPGFGLSILAQSGDATGNGSAPVPFTVTVNGITSLAYQWEIKRDGLFVALTNDANHLDVTLATLMLTNVSAALNNNEYRCRVQDGFGCVVYSEPARFLFQGEPAVVTLAPSSTSPNSARLNASINPNGQPLQWFFEYGTSPNYGRFTETNALPATNAALSVSNSITGLIPGTLYHFRAVAVSPAGSVAGADATFTTPGLPAPSLNVGGVMANGELQINFTSVPGASFSVLSSADLALAASQWTVLGSVTEIAPGQFRFTAPTPVNSSHRFYRVSSP